MSDIETYTMLLYNFTQLQRDLISHLNQKITLIKAKLDLWEFSPLYSTVSEQIKNWPKDSLIFPISTWVRPNRGNIEFNKNNWSFIFTGQGVAFVNQENLLDVSVEYATTGQICVTPWIVGRYIRSYYAGLPNESLLGKNTSIFNHLVKIGTLIEVEVTNKGFEGPVYVLKTRDP